MLLDKINKPNDIKNIDKDKLNDLAKEIREFLIEKISLTGGHLASNLGCVELTMALHLALDLPKDKIVWDVGHQSYTHKLLTGRRDGFDNLRKYGGMSGFPKRCESDCDCFDTGHSSTSISAALGMVKAREINGTDETVVAVIGDGSLTGGMAYEALNNASRMNSNFIIILNDNNMSISENVGGVSKYLNEIRTANHYINLRDKVYYKMLDKPNGHKVINTVRKTKNVIKQLVVPGMFFEDMGITYLGPVDGHNLNELNKVLKDAKRVNKAVIVHVITKKGKGYEPAEKHPSRFHGAEPFDINTGIPSTKREKANYTDVFSTVMVKLGARNEKVVAITAAMPDGTGLKRFHNVYPDRFFDVGIAEQHAVTFAAGLATGGLIPIVAIYSSFLQRAYDQILHDVCIQNLHVVFAIDRAGLVGSDGETHQGIFDIPMLTAIPGVTIYSPFNYAELDRVLKIAFAANGVQAVRYPRDSEKSVSPKYTADYHDFDFFENGKDSLIVTYGRLFAEACSAAEETGASVLKLGKVFPIDAAAVEKAAAFKNVFFFEESVMNGSAAEHFGTALHTTSFCGKYIIKCVDGFVPHMNVSSAMKKYGLDCESMAAIIKKEALE